MIFSGNKPHIINQVIKISNVKNSRLVISWYFIFLNVGLIVPKNSLLKNSKLYIVFINKPKNKKIIKKLKFVCKIPQKHKISLIKLMLPGKPIFVSININIIVQKIGMVVTKPFEYIIFLVL